MGRPLAMNEPPAIYRRLPRALGAPPSAYAGVVPSLVDIWLMDSMSSRSDDVVEVRIDGFSYLFDHANERLIAAWGISTGKSDAPRPKRRMQGHPLSAGPLYHRGHAIPHTLGGGTDINLVPQLGWINTGPFRRLEIKAVATAGALYFTYWRYHAICAGAHRPVQLPTGVDQGLITPGHEPEIIRHGN